MIRTLNEQKSFSRTYEPFEGEEFGYVLKGKVENAPDYLYFCDENKADVMQTIWVSSQIHNINGK